MVNHNTHFTQLDISVEKKSVNSLWYFVHGNKFVSCGILMAYNSGSHVRSQDQQHQYHLGSC